jgi:hypothetical protein
VHSFELSFVDIATKNVFKPVTLEPDFCQICQEFCLTIPVSKNLATYSRLNPIEYYWIGSQQSLEIIRTGTTTQLATYC